MNVTIAASFVREDGYGRQYIGIPVSHVGACEHVDTVCEECWESWANDHTFNAPDVPAAIREALRFAGDVELVRSLAASTSLDKILYGLRHVGRSEEHIAEVLGAASADVEAPVPADQPGAERLAVWTLTRMDPCSTVQEGDYHEMYVVAQSAQAAREWAYRRATLDNKPEPKVWLKGDEFALRVLHFYDVDDDAETGVQLAEVWTVEKMATVPFRRR